jgi:hypothetical protein
MYITYGEAIDAATVLASNFVYVRGEDSKVVNGLPASATVSLINSNKTVKITWATAAANATEGLNPTNIVQIQWSGLKGTDGNTVTANVQTKAAQVGAAWAVPGAAPALGAVAVTGAKTITAVVANPTNFIFDTSKALADFTLYKTGDAATKYNLINAAYDSTTQKITFTTYETISADATIASTTLTLATKATTTLVDLFGQTFTVSAGVVADDTFKPTATLAAPSAAAGTVVVTLSEAMEINNAAMVGAMAAGPAAQFVITIDGVTKAFTASTDATNKIVTFTITGGFVTAKSVVVNYFASPTATDNLTDAATLANSLANFSLSGTTAP